MKSTSNKKIRLIPLTLDDGTTAKIDANSLKDWNVHHGKTAKGVQVDSLNSKNVGKTIFLKSGENGPAFSIKKDEFEVAAVQILQDMGYKVTYQQSTS